MTTELHQPLSGLLDGGAHARADLVRGGVSTHDLRGSAWRRTNRGLWVHTPDGVIPRGPWDRIRQAAPLTGEHGAIGGWAAAHAHGVLDLDGLGPDRRELPVMLCRPRASRCRRTQGIELVRSDLSDDDIVVIDGVQVTSRLRTAVDLARLTTSFVEAVVRVDAMMRDGEAAGGLAAEMGEWLGRHPRRRGVAQARRVLAFARAGVESLPESRLRLIWVVEARLPPPLVNPWVYSRDGRLLGRADLMDEGAALIGEYDGGHHATAARRSKDHQRREDMQGGGLIVLQFTGVDIGPRRPTAVARLHAAHAAGMMRDRSRDHWVIGDPPSWARSGGSWSGSRSQS
ncbi:MAG: hypothetical protein IPK24_11345 [Kineosporiaceae bacterium]|nr:hypothetical protein [Kineosporiaceae bacterium]